MALTGAKQPPSFSMDESAWRVASRCVGMERNSSDARVQRGKKADSREEGKVGCLAVPPSRLRPDGGHHSRGLPTVARFIKEGPTVAPSPLRWATSA